MTDLDDKLLKILVPFAYTGMGLDPEGSPGEDEIQNEVNEAIAQIKQAFEDERYISPENAEIVQGALNHMAQLANDSFRQPIIQYVSITKDQRMARMLMTGQEWYDKFEKELDNTIFATDYDSDRYGPLREIMDRDTVKEAAKRASGIKD